MDNSREALLRPTLSADRVLAVPYSVQATFFTGFFGGPFAALLLIAINSYRLQRVVRDLPALVLMLLLGLGALWLSVAPTALYQSIDTWISDTIQLQSQTVMHRFVALSIVGLGYLLHRREQRNSTVLGLERPNGWLAGILCMAAGYALLRIPIVLLRGG